MFFPPFDRDPGARGCAGTGKIAGIAWCTCYLWANVSLALSADKWVLKHTINVPIDTHTSILKARNEN